MNQNPKCTFKMHHNKFVSICNSYGYSIYELSDPTGDTPHFSNGNIAKLIYGEKIEGIKIVEPLYAALRFSVALIKHCKVDFLEIIDTKTKKSIFKNTGYETPVLSCASIEFRLFVCFEKCIHLYYMLSQNESKLYILMLNTPDIIYTARNPDAIFTCGNTCFIYPHDLDCGVVKIHGLIERSCIGIIQTQTKPLSAIALSNCARYLATSAKLGTVIHVYSCTTIDNQPVYVFRRGMFSANITYLSFSSDSKFLGCSSDKKTIHIFNLSEEFKEQKKNWLNFLSNALTTERAYYTVNLSKAGPKCNFVIKSTDLITLFEITDEGKLTLYSIIQRGAKGMQLELFAKQELLDKDPNVN